jgi:hypothetical protein
VIVAGTQVPHPRGKTAPEVLLRYARTLIAITSAAALLVVGTGAAKDEPVPVIAEDSSAQVLALTQTTQSLREQLRSERARTARLVRAERQRAAEALRRARRAVARSATVEHAIAVGAAAFGQSRDRLRRVANCESTLNPDAANGPYAGLFQWGTPLWNNSPFREFSRNDPYAAALATSWAFSEGMSAHWPVCGQG